MFPYLQKLRLATSGDLFSFTGVTRLGQPVRQQVPAAWLERTLDVRSGMEIRLERTTAGNAGYRIQESKMDSLATGGIDVQIRWMIRRDMPEVLNIEQGSFEFPWSEEDFIRCLRQRNCIGMVAENANRVVGFMIYELNRNQLHILNFAVRPDFRRRGIGRQMGEKLIGKLSQQRRNRIVLEVRETNLAAQVFFRRIGFKAMSVLRDFYDDTTEDAYVMHFSMGEVEETFAPVNRITRFAG